MPEVADQYKGAEILLLREDHMVRGHSVAWRHDTSGDILDGAHANPILDTRMYQEEFNHHCYCRINVHPV